MSMILAGFVFPFIKDIAGKFVDNLKENKSLKIEKESEIEKLRLQLELQKAGADEATEKRMLAESTLKLDIIKSNNEVEIAQIELRKAEINAPNVSFVAPLEYFEIQNFWHFLYYIFNFFILIVNLFCHLTVCATNCFKTIPLFLLTILIGCPIAWILFNISFTELVNMNERQITFLQNYEELLEVIVGYFAGRKLVERGNNEQTQKKNS